MKTMESSNSDFEKELEKLTKEIDALLNMEKTVDDEKEGCLMQQVIGLRTKLEEVTSPKSIDVKCRIVINLLSGVESMLERGKLFIDDFTNAINKSAELFEDKFTSIIERTKDINDDLIAKDKERKEKGYNTPEHSFNGIVKKAKILVSDTMAIINKIAKENESGKSE